MRIIIVNPPRVAAGPICRLPVLSALIWVVVVLIALVPFNFDTDGMVEFAFSSVSASASTHVELTVRHIVPQRV